MTRHANIFSNFCIFAEVGMCWCYGTFFASCVKDTVQGNCNAMYTTGYRYAGIYRQSRVLTVIYNCSFPGRTPRRWWTGPTASATTSHVTATTGSSAPDPTTGNASAVCTYAAPFLHRGLRRMCVGDFAVRLRRTSQFLYIYVRYSGEHYYDELCFTS